MRKILALLLGMALVLISPMPVLAFSDTTEHWAAVSIDHLTARDILHGRTKDLFVPEGSVTRAEFAVLLVNGLGLSNEAINLQKGVCMFRDVSSTYWAKGSLELCREMGIMIPDAAGRCYPNRAINRGEAAAMIARALNLTGSAAQPFSDWDSIPVWAQTAASAVQKHAIINGYPDRSFRAQAALTRAQAAVVMENILNFHGEKYMAAGTITRLNRSLRAATVTINGKSWEVDLADGFTYIALQKGKPVIPSFCYMDFNQEGDLIYCQETADEEPSRLIINTKSRGSNTERSTVASAYSLIPESSATVSNNIDPRVSSQVNRSVVKADALQNAAGADGSGVRVAIIDSGIDPGHPDLFKTSDGKAKVIDWIDLTQEGQVNLQSGTIINGKLVLANTSISLDNWKSMSGNAHYGYFDQARLPAKIKSANDAGILVVALDTKRASVYDTILVDTNGNGSLADEKPLHKYSLSQEYSSFTTEEGKPFNFLISEIGSTGGYVKLGFDANGHGTKMAGIIAGNGLVQGIATGAQVLAVKVFEGYGANDVSRLKEAIKIVGDMGVDVVNISMGYTNLPDVEKAELEDVINTVSQGKGVVFCIAAGNMGPGLGSIASPSSAARCIGVGGYITPEMWLLNYGWKVDQPTLWQFSSVGPDDEGGYPEVVAPASAVSTNVLWKDNFSLDEGTSIATPYVTGGAALLICAAHKAGIKATPDMIRQAIAQGASPVGQYQPCEVGHGCLNLAKAWEVLKEKPVVPLTITQGEGDAGLFSRNNLPAQSWLKLTNAGGSRFINFSATASWIKLGQDKAQVPSRGLRDIRLQYASLNTPGLYSGFIVGDDPATSGVDMEALETTVVPYILQGNAGNIRLDSDQLPTGLYKRYFIKIPKGKGKLIINITIPRDVSGKYLGRVRLHLTSPNGQLFQSTGYAGCGYPDSSPLQTINVTLDNPQSGVWEADVFSSVTLSQYGLTASQYSIEAGLSNWSNVESSPADDRYVVSAVPGPLKTGETSWITLYFWDKISNMAGRGKIVINDMLYEIKDGKIQLMITPADNKPVLELAW